MTVRDLDSMTAEGRGQGTRARRRKRSVEVKRLDGDAAALDLSREPSLACRGYEDDTLGARRLKVRGQIRHHPLGAARSVGFDQLGDAHDAFCRPTESATSV